jgi:3-deoxy-7-phosphoheptulonate synthase
MHPPTSDLRIRAQKPLIAPAVLEDELPLSDAGAEVVTRSRREVANIVTGVDDRLLVVVGPCSIHDSAAALEYAERLRDVAPIHQGELLLIMRVYFEKPRTVLDGKVSSMIPFWMAVFRSTAG